jgi:hypothetical protein
MEGESLALVLFPLTLEASDVTLHTIMIATFISNEACGCLTKGIL